MLKNELSKSPSLKETAIKKGCWQPIRSAGQPLRREQKAVGAI